MQDSSSEDVKNLQTMLKGLGLNPERADGYFSEKTALAVKAFQRMQNLPITGEVDTETATRLEKMILAEIKDPKNDLQLKAATQHLQSIMTK